MDETNQPMIALGGINRVLSEEISGETANQYRESGGIMGTQGE